MAGRVSVFGFLSPRCSCGRCHEFNFFVQFLFPDLVEFIFQMQKGLHHLGVKVGCFQFYDDVLGFLVSIRRLVKSLGS